MKAIETKYKGYKFRSRLEARWAVFFDAIGLEWLYEAEGFDLGDRGYYLPDFYLPETERYVEIKPALPTMREIDKMVNLATSANQTRGVMAYHYILCGTPGPPGFTVEKAQGGGLDIKPSSYVALATCGASGMAPQLQAFYAPSGNLRLRPHLESLYCSVRDFARVPAKISARDISRATNNELVTLLVCGIFVGGGEQGADSYALQELTSLYLGDGRRVNSQTLRKGYDASRSARFEHGQSGATT